MKIKTNAGEVDLTAEMVCRGMVLRVKHWECLYPDGVVTLMERDREWWSTATGERCNPLADGVRDVTFLGCDPTIATRADCERFGVHGDAAAHGFARLRDGGAVDLRNPENMRKGMVLWSPEWFGDGRATLDSVSGTGEAGTWWNVRPCGGVVPTTAHKFIGLDDRCARPEDVERLCCGEAGPAESGEMEPRCTLAIGDHDTHEDLATGVRWAATPYDPSLSGCPGCLTDRSGAHEPSCSRMSEAAAAIAQPPECAECGYQVCDETCPKRRREARRNQEAPLVALVNAVPEGLDPVGWRAAVLAYCEQGPDYRSALTSSKGIQRNMAATVRKVMSIEASGGKPLFFSYISAVCAYRRAITPAPKVTPERRGTTWKTRGPVLAVDDGRDDE